MKKTYIIPVLETVRVSRMLMQSSVKSISTNLGDKPMNYGGESAGNTGARSDFFGGLLWDDEE